MLASQSMMPYRPWTGLSGWDLFSVKCSRVLSLIRFTKQCGPEDKEAVRAAVQNNPGCLMEMEDDGAFGYTALHVAAEKDFREMAELLLSLGANVNVRARNGETPLITAVGERHDVLALLFIAKGADVRLASDDGITALHFAAIENMPTLRRH